MIRLAKFYGLISRNAHVTLTNTRMDASLYEGTVDGIPDEFDDCEVADFAVSNEGDFLFKLSIKSRAKTPEDRLWHEGTLKFTTDVFHYWYKQYDTPSEYGIDGGRISKLTIKRDGDTVCNYDRGWDIRPADTESLMALEVILRTQN